MSKRCITIASNDLNELKVLANKALNKAELIEIRFDYIDKDNIDNAIEIVKRFKDRAIFTCRSVNEGGRFNGSEEERLSIIDKLITANPMLVDIEYNTLLTKRFNADNILVSWHNFEYTPTNEELTTQMKNMLKFSNNIKIVTFAKNIKDNLIVLDLYNKIDNNTKLLAFCMGEFGKASRVLSMLYGAPFTYTTLDNPVAPGQLQIDHLDKIVRNARVDDVILNRIIHIIDETL